MTTLPITTLAVGIFALLMVPLSLQVSMRRVKRDGLVFGDGGDDTLRRRIRAHGNFVEYVPLGVLALALVEFAGASSGLVWGLACALLGSRALHALGMLYGSTPAPRAVAMLIGHGFFLVAGGWLISAFAS